jgi:hypothetical protein
VDELDEAVEVLCGDLHVVSERERAMLLLMVLTASFSWSK